jgi:RHH-type proline utilization regulon transcriptional repressor/proline dehydrogenase/delta 1-pyrroline-5-carboxylate dehydrogenase
MARSDCRPWEPPPQAQARRWGERLAEELGRLRHSPVGVLEQRLMRGVITDPALRAALFRFVDVRPACTTRAELVRHLDEYLREARASPTARHLQPVLAHRTLQPPTASLAALAVGMVAHRFIAGADARAARGELAAMWSAGRAATVDLLGEATLTEAEGEAYAERCGSALRTLAAAASAWPARPLLERDAFGALPRVNLSVKVSALTPHLRAHAPDRAFAGCAERLRALLRSAHQLGAHIQVDMESLDSRESVTELVLKLLAEPEFAPGPSAGIVLQAYLTDSDAELETLLAWVANHPRRQPFTIRLVKGAYWDHEVVQAAQAGWPAPVFTDRRDCDRQFERLTHRLLDACAGGLPLRVAIASHNLRSLAYALALSDQLALPAATLELQVLRGLGDGTAAAIAALGRRVRVYCPVGALVAGMAYLVRRLLENTSNDSFLAAHAAGVDLGQLMEQP